jgi:menaquinone-9 beta-reductase
LRVHAESGSRSSSTILEPDHLRTSEKAAATRYARSSQRARVTPSTTPFDAIIVGGGPAGSTCARLLVRRGMRVAVLDRRQFPRVKLCGGWLSPPVWEVLELSRREYPGGLWPWRRCHVQYRGRCHSLAARGDFIRRSEFDHFLLRRSGATVIEGRAAEAFQRANGLWVVDGAYKARWLVGAGGTHCPVARKLFPARPGHLVAAQEREFELDAAEIADTRLGADGEPELLLHDDLGGYSWNVPKGGWLNVGTGTAATRQVRSAAAAARSFFLESGHVPPSAREPLQRMEGHSYYLFDPAHLDTCHRDGAFLVGDALGLAHPFTAEGILPAVVSGRICAEAILDGAPGGYGARLAGHPTMRDYALTRELLHVLARRRSASAGPRAPGWLTEVGHVATARIFAWMFGGRRVPGGRVWRAALRLGGSREMAR